jgi:flavin-binding protein dodecin
MVLMADSVYRVTELVGTSSESWEQAAAAAVETASQTLRDLRIAEVVELDLQLEGGSGPTGPASRSRSSTSAAATPRTAGTRRAALHLLTTQATGVRND